MKRIPIFEEVRLATDKINELRSFYGEELGLTLEESGDEFSIVTDRKKLTFYANRVPGSNPTYHFAFNISENKIELARSWLSQRVELVPSSSGEEIYSFDSWNAHAIYFVDPAGNIGEFIARHSLPTATSGSFSPADVLRLSEIGLVVDDVPSVLQVLEERLLFPRYGEGSDEFQAMGSEYALMIVARRGRTWFGGRGGVAEVHPIEITILGNHPDELQIEGLPYKISVAGMA